MSGLHGFTTLRFLDKGSGREEGMIVPRVHDSFALLLGYVSLSLFLFLHVAKMGCVSCRFSGSVKQVCAQKWHFLREAFP